MPLPDTPGCSSQPSRAQKVPAAWGGVPVTVVGMSVLDRHVHPDTRADLKRLAALANRPPS
ncbi:hypothetical protein [Micromonospora parva]|uniref:hypothetical protein n=1 Tax=Micromonospora parva TaxID=1464048 RepID=UPI0033E3847F